VRKHIEHLVHNTQFGFVPGRTIHEDIGLFEAANADAEKDGSLGFDHYVLDPSHVPQVP
jgi:hypothetical protein